MSYEKPTPPGGAKSGAVEASGDTIPPELGKLLQQIADLPPDLLALFRRLASLPPQMMELLQQLASMPEAQRQAVIDFLKRLDNLAE